MSYSKLDRRIIDTYNKIVSALPNKSADRRIAECVDKDPDTGLIKAVGVYDTKTKKYAIVELNNYRTKRFEDIKELGHIKQIISQAK
mgnify:FL=1